MSDLEHLGCVQDAFVVGDIIFLGCLGICGHEVGLFSDFLDRRSLGQNEKVVIGGVRVGEDQLDRLPSLNSELVLSEKKALGDCSDFENRKVLLSIELLLFPGEFCFRFDDRLGEGCEFLLGVWKPMNFEFL